MREDLDLGLEELLRRKLLEPPKSAKYNPPAEHVAELDRIILANSQLPKHQHLSSRTMAEWLGKRGHPVPWRTFHGYTVRRLKELQAAAAKEG